jgi:hypothetical protein
MRCDGEKEFVAQCNEQFKAAKECSIAHCSGQPVRSRNDFLAAKQQHIRRQQRKLQRTHDEARQCHSSGERPSDSARVHHKAKAGLSKQNVVLIFYCPKRDPHAKRT